MQQLAPPESILDTLYDCATDFEKWPVFQARLCEEFDAKGSVVQYGDIVAKDFSFFAFYGIDPNCVTEYAKCIDTDPRMPVFRRLPGRPLSCHLHLPADAWERSDMKRLFRTFGTEYSLSSVWFEEYRTVIAIVLFRAAEFPPFNEEECLRFGEYTSHVRRTIDLQRRFAVIQEETWSAQSTLDEMPIGVVVCDSESRIVFANRTARSIAADGDGLLIRHNQLWATQQEASADLRATVRRLLEATMNDGTKASVGLSLARASSVRPLQVRLTPIWKNESAPFPPLSLNRPLCAVYITDPDQPSESDTELLQRLFGLTPREADVLSSIVYGRSVQETARAFGVAASTVRTHLKSLFSKTDTSSQSALVRLVAGSPAWSSHQASLR